jgi:AraC-like DNA-binding protein
VLATEPINSVADLSAQTQTSPRQLQRLMKDAYGFSPKIVMRRARIQRTIQAMKRYTSVDWQLQAEQDFADQPHLINEFKHFTGHTPHTYLEMRNPIMDAAHAMQSALFRNMREAVQPQQRIKVQMKLDSAEAQVRGHAAAA